jgi:hypothetical protein
VKKNATNWEQINIKNVFKKNKYFLLKLSIETYTTGVSAQELITSKDTKEWYNNLIIDKISNVHLKSVEKSRLGRNLSVLDIYKEKKEKKPIVVLLTRHPPEVTGFFAFQEFIKTI